jgi:hypothetical protein
MGCASALWLRFEADRVLGFSVGLRFSRISVNDLLKTELNLALREVKRKAGREPATTFVVFRVLSYNSLETR